MGFGSLIRILLDACCTTGCGCHLEMNRPFASLNLGMAGCFEGFGTSGLILTNRPIIGSLGLMHFAGSRCAAGCAALSLNGSLLSKSS